MNSYNFLELFELFGIDTNSVAGSPIVFAYYMNPLEKKPLIGFKNSNIITGQPYTPFSEYTFFALSKRTCLHSFKVNNQSEINVQDLYDLIMTNISSIRFILPEDLSTSNKRKYGSIFLSNRMSVNELLELSKGHNRYQSIIDYFSKHVNKEELASCNNIINFYENGRNQRQNTEFYIDDRPHYGNYAGSYAQDVMGYSDEDIDDAFEGDPDAYWNID